MGVELNVNIFFERMNLKMRILRKVRKDLFDKFNYVLYIELGLEDWGINKFFKEIFY